MSNEAPTDALRLVPTRDDGLRVGRAILEAHSQWEKEHGVTGAQNPWQEQHIILLGQAAILAASASPLPEGGGTSYAAGGLDVLSRIRSRLNEQIERAEADLNSTVTIRLNDAKAIRHLLAPAAPTGEKK